MSLWPVRRSQQGGGSLLAALPRRGQQEMVATTPGLLLFWPWIPGFQSPAWKHPGGLLPTG